jgi:hypothetical protein
VPGLYSYLLGRERSGGLQSEASLGKKVHKTPIQPIKSWVQWLTYVIPATQETKIKRIMD